MPVTKNYQPRTPDCSYENGIRRITDKHLCLFLLSSEIDLGLRYYKSIKYPPLKFGKDSKQVTNCLDYLKRIKVQNPHAFLQLCKLYLVNCPNNTGIVGKFDKEDLYQEETDNKREEVEAEEEKEKKEIIYQPQKKEVVKSLTLQYKRMTSVSNHSEFDYFLLDQCNPTKIMIPHKDGRVDFRLKVFPDWEGDIYLLQCQQKLLMDSHYSRERYFDPKFFMENDGNIDQNNIFYNGLMNEQIDTWDKYLLKNILGKGNKRLVVTTEEVVEFSYKMKPKL